MTLDMFSDPIDHDADLVRLGDRFAGAIFGRGGIASPYRYSLHRHWGDDDDQTMLGLFLNPSTATHTIVDPTIAGMIKRARAMAFGGLRIGNVYGFRATQPSDMLASDDPVGPFNDEVLADEASRAAMIVCGWGRHAKPERIATVLDVLGRVGAISKLYAFEVNRDGSPQHPLYIAHNVRPTPWVPKVA